MATVLVRTPTHVVIEDDRDGTICRQLRRKRADYADVVDGRRGVILRFDPAYDSAKIAMLQAEPRSPGDPAQRLPLARAGLGVLERRADVDAFAPTTGVRDFQHQLLNRGAV